MAPLADAPTGFTLDAGAFNCQPGPIECQVSGCLPATHPNVSGCSDDPTLSLWCERCPSWCFEHEPHLLRCFRPDQYCTYQASGNVLADLECTDSCDTGIVCTRGPDSSDFQVVACCPEGWRCAAPDYACVPPAACRDGVDNDGDGVVDFPYDEGCADADDETECGPGVADDFDEAELADCQWSLGDDAPSYKNALLAGGRLWQSAVPRIFSAGRWHIEGDFDVRVTIGVYMTADWPGTYAHALMLEAPDDEATDWRGAGVQHVGDVACLVFDGVSCVLDFDVVLGPPPAVLRVTRTADQYRMFAGVAGEWQEVGVDRGPFVGWDGPVVVELLMPYTEDGIEPGSAWMDDFEVVTGQVVFDAE